MGVSPWRLDSWIDRFSVIPTLSFPEKSLNTMLKSREERNIEMILSVPKTT